MNDTPAKVAGIATGPLCQGYVLVLGRIVRMHHIAIGGDSNAGFEHPYAGRGRGPETPRLIVREQRPGATVSLDVDWLYHSHRVSRSSGPR